jgi:cytochrome c
MKKKLIWLPAISVLALPLVHPFGPVRQQHSLNTLPEVPAAIERACQNCHSQRTKWPLYSYLPLVSWALEKDVAEARQHMDLSRWDQYSTEEKRDLLARIGTEVRNRRMPLPRYLLLHPEARLSDAEIQGIYEWTKAQRRAIRNERE